MATTAYVRAEELLADLPLDARVEVDEGTVVAMSPTNVRHGRVAAAIFLRLAAHVEQHGLGETFTEGTGFILRRGPDVLRAPDVAFVAGGRLAADADRGFAELAPDLAVEVLSPSETASAVGRKVDQYLRAGVRAVWVIDPATRSVTVYTADRTVRRLEEAEALDGGDVVPGFSLPISELFARIARG